MCSIPYCDRNSVPFVLVSIFLIFFLIWWYYRYRYRPRQGVVTSGPVPVVSTATSVVSYPNTSGGYPQPAAYPAGGYPGGYQVSCWHMSIESKDVIVQTKFGKIRGLTRSFRQEDGKSRVVHVFRGIPYAQPPIKKLRFEPPQPLHAWQPEVFNAQQFGNICPQKDGYFNYLYKSIKRVWPGFSSKDVSEDCLHLNIYSPTRDSKSILYPVLLYIHGGTYLLGTPARDKTPGHILPALNGIILVTIQYRLGPFGFLTTGDSVLPGNNGMLDQIEALKWVKENIVDFGGDPSRITIAGNSAGGSSVGLLILSPLTKGLFHRAIMESGVEFSPFAILPLEKAVKMSKIVADKLLCKTNDSQKMVDCLRNKDVSDILFYYDGFPGPVVDNYFLPDTPENLRKKGLDKNVSVVMGFTKHDGSHMINPLKLRLPLNNVYFRKGIERTVQLHIGIENHLVAKRMADALEFQYYPWHKVGDSKALLSGLIKLLTDYFIIGPTFKAANYHSKHSPTYVYRYGHLSKKSKKTLVSHSSNVDYGFGAPFANITYQNFSDEDRNVSHFIMTCYANFVKYGNPTRDRLRKRPMKRERDYHRETTRTTRDYKGETTRGRLRERDYEGEITSDRLRGTDYKGETTRGRLRERDYEGEITSDRLRGTDYEWGLRGTDCEGEATRGRLRGGDYEGETTRDRLRGRDYEGQTTRDRRRERDYEGETTRDRLRGRDYEGQTARQRLRGTADCEVETTRDRLRGRDYEGQTTRDRRRERDYEGETTRDRLRGRDYEGQTARLRRGDYEGRTDCEVETTRDRLRGTDGERETTRGRLRGTDGERETTRGRLRGGDYERETTRDGQTARERLRGRDYEGQTARERLRGGDYEGETSRERRRGRDYEGQKARERLRGGDYEGQTTRERLRGGDYTRNRRRERDYEGETTRDRRRERDYEGETTRDRRRERDYEGETTRDRRRERDYEGETTRDRRRERDYEGETTRERLREGDYEGRTDGERETKRERLRGTNGERETTRGRLRGRDIERETARERLRGTDDERETTRGRLRGTDDERETTRGRLRGTEGERETTRGRLRGTEGERETTRERLRGGDYEGQKARERLRGG
ncbi:hypothetical protein QZH41_002529 [Actinostola sp. cb2023]|nr:hypothetical protein QZH41_002529 [Actinostola sp. cb2023]